MTIGTDFTPIETIQRFTPVGVEFWDLLNSAPITDGLAVSGRVVGHRGRFHAASASPRGVHVVAGLPALRELEDLRPEPGEFELQPTAPVIDLDLQVVDRLGRFLPTVLRVSAPQSGLVTAADALSPCPTLALSVPDDAPPFLLSAPTRHVPSSAASLRTHLRDRSTGKAAAHAVVSVTVGGLSYVGAADGIGQVLLPFAYPPFVDSLATDSVPPGAHGLPTTEQTWSVSFRVRSRAVDALEFPAGVDIPLYHSLLCQPPAPIWIDAADDDPTPELVADLTFGQELFLTTAGIDESELLIDFAP